MNPTRSKRPRLAGLFALTLALSLSACGGGGSDSSSGGGGSGGSGGGSGGGGGGGGSQSAFRSEPLTAAFLTQATFGPSQTEIDRLTGQSASQWFQDQTSMAPTYLRPRFEQHMNVVVDGGYSGFRVASPTLAFWRNAVGAPDQLRQRMAFALSQILVVSASSGNLRGSPEGMVYYQDLLIEHAFGNYRDLLEDVTYSPAMGYYLTYIGSRKADPDTGRMPDENYARELLQLFTIGVVDTDMQGRERLDSSGAPIELYDNTDITGLARVFTGFEYALDGRTSENRRERMQRPLFIDERDHEDGAKSFLGLTIPAGTPGPDSVDMALDHIMAQPTVAPFVSRQLIQRFVTSHPDPAYVGRVAEAFERGTYQLPNAVTVGEGRRGDLLATLAAVLFDDAARNVEANRRDAQFGKIREPILRVAHWARAFGADPNDTEYLFNLYDTRDADELAQHPYQSPSVFNFYRPGFIAPGTQTGAQNLTMPELQLVNTATAAGYVNALDDFVLQDENDRDLQRIRDKLANLRADLPAEPGVNAWVASYNTELGLLDTPNALLDHLDLVLTAGTLSEGTRALVLEFLEDESTEDTPEARRDQVQMAVLLIMTSPDYLVQR
jgi:uncharacterized protein (DUF1800 family)